MYLQIQKINQRETQQKPYLVISTSAFTRLTVSMRSGGTPHPPPLNFLGQMIFPEIFHTFLRD